MLNGAQTAASSEPLDVVADVLNQPTPIEHLRDANEHLILAALRAQAEAEAAVSTADRLRDLVSQLETSQTALREKVEELENFHDLVVCRELKMMQVEKENERLRREVDRLQSAVAGCSIHSDIVSSRHHATDSHLL